MKSVTITRFPEVGYACAEALNTLCTSITFSGENVKRVLITSCHSSEGKSYLSMNIMRTLAGFGKTVALIDADMRLSGITTRYGLAFADEKRTGLSHMLAGMAEPEQVIYETDIPGAYIVPVGRLVSNTMPLLNSPRFVQLLDTLSGIAEYVIIDTPPLGEIVDAKQIAKFCDAAVIAVKYNSVHRSELIDVKEQLEATGCLVLGTVLNKVDMESYMNRKYYHKHEYGKYDHYGKNDTGHSSLGRMRIFRKKSGKAK